MEPPTDIDPILVTCIIIILCAIPLDEHNIMPGVARLSSDQTEREREREREREQERERERENIYQAKVNQKLST